MIQPENRFSYFTKFKYRRLLHLHNSMFMCHGLGSSSNKSLKHTLNTINTTISENLRSFTNLWRIQLLRQHHDPCEGPTEHSEEYVTCDLDLHGSIPYTVSCQVQMGVKKFAKLDPE